MEIYVSTKNTWVSPKLPPRSYLRKLLARAKEGGEGVVGVNIFLHQHRGWIFSQPIPGHPSTHQLTAQHQLKISLLNLTFDHSPSHQPVSPCFWPEFVALPHFLSEVTEIQCVDCVLALVEPALWWRSISGTECSGTPAPAGSIRQWYTSPWYISQWYTSPGAQEVTPPPPIAISNWLLHLGSHP